MSCSCKFLPSEAACVGFKRKTNTYNRLQQSMEGKDKHNMTGGCHFVSWHLFLLRFVSGFCSKSRYLFVLSPPPYPALLEDKALSLHCEGHQDI